MAQSASHEPHGIMKKGNPRSMDRTTSCALRSLLLPPHPSGLAEIPCYVLRSVYVIGEIPGSDNTPKLGGLISTDVAKTRTKYAACRSLSLINFSNLFPSITNLYATLSLYT
jgi:hypothetical protein